MTASPAGGHDGEKTQDGIETCAAAAISGVRHVTTGRKPKTGLKQTVETPVEDDDRGHDGEKTQDGIETRRRRRGRRHIRRSRRGENPRRD